MKRFATVVTGVVMAVTIAANAIAADRSAHIPSVPTTAPAHLSAAPKPSRQTNTGFTVDQPKRVKALLPRVQQKQIYTTMKELSTKWPNRITTTTNARKAAGYLKGRYEKTSAGKSYVKTELVNCARCGQGPLVIHTIEGTKRDAEYVVIGGHYDSTVNGRGVKDARTIAPGADDNASSQGVMLEALRVLHQANWRPWRTVVFVSYPAEETGLNGSAAAAELFANQDKQVIAHLGIDMTNYMPAQRSLDIKYVADFTDPELNQHLTSLVRTYLPKMRIGGSKCGYECSDHAPWTRRGVPSTTMEEPVMNPRLHTPQDTLASMGNTAAPSVKFAQLTIAFAVETAKTGRSKSAKPKPKPEPSPIDEIGEGTGS